MATADHLRIVDNTALDSSMDSTQGLLSFMTNASRQIKTYLGPEQQQTPNQVRICNAFSSLLQKDFYLTSFFPTYIS